MTVQRATCYWLTCNNCGLSSISEPAHPPFASPEEAEEDGRELGWVIENDAHICADCKPDADPFDTDDSDAA